MTKPVNPEELIQPPAHLPEDVAEVWREIVASNDLVANVDRTALETYCTLMARLRDARRRVEAEGLIVKDDRGRVGPHPALAVERATAEQVRSWGDRFAPLVKPARKRGYMADATAISIADHPHLSGPKYAGAVAAVKTLAWMIDEAQRDSMEALQKAMATTVPNYLKACAELQITPASLPTGATKAKGGSPDPAPKEGEASNVSSFQDRARSRRSG